MNNKVYIVFTDYAYDFDQDYYINGVFTDYKTAKMVFDKAVEENERIDKDNGYDMFEKEKETYNAWKDGEYNLNHTTITLGEYKLDKIYKEK